MLTGLRVLRRALRLTLSVKIILSVAGLLVGLSVGVAALTFVQMRRAAIEEQVKLLDVLNYTFEILLSQEALPSLQRVTENTATIRGVRSIVIVDRSGKALASSARGEVGREVDYPVAREFLARATGDRAVVTTDADLLLLQPLRGRYSAGGAAGDIVGVAQVTLPLEDIERTARSSALQLLMVSLGSYLLLFVLLASVLRALVTSPVQALASAARRFQSGDRSTRSGLQRRDEIGLLSRTFDGMADEVDATLRGLEGRVASRTAALEEERSALERAMAELKESTAARLALAETVRELSTPVIKLHDRILVMPLIGAIDADRARQIETSLLEGIRANRAEEVILDVTGILAVDADVAASLMRAIGAARMLGARVTLVGIRPGVALSVVELGLDFDGVEAHADLQEGLRAALRRLGSGARWGRSERSGRRAGG
jgi:anti-anti-sigma regulatory factor/HAMP domain-containing protein